jgi:ComF family protein
MLRALLSPSRWPLPGGCQICLSWGCERLCEACVKRFGQPVARCPRCALVQVGPHCAACMQAPMPLDGAVAAVDYEAPWDTLLHGLKYGSQLSAALALAPLLGQAVRSSGLDCAGMHLLPVPLHPQRLCERGYNQSEHLARALRQNLGLPLLTDTLQRVIETPTQTQLSREDRLKQLRQAFALKPGASVQGLRIALVDDVMTTGATMSAIATLLHRHGAAEVHAWAVARTPSPQHA